MSRWLRLSTAQTERIGPFLDKTDGVTEEVSLGSPPTEISKDGAAFATGPVGTHDAEGWYSVPFTTAHTNTLGSLVLKSHDVATHLPVWHEFMVIPANVYDSLVLGTDTLPADVTQWLGTAAATPTVAGVPEVDITHTDGVSGAGNAIANALLDLANAIETGLTLREAQRLIAAASAAKLSGAATTTITIRNAVADSKNRIIATVDADGNRSAITYDVT